MLTICALTTLLAGSALAAQPASQPEDIDWTEAEASVLTGHLQLTSRDEFLKAGEAYFSADGAWIVFQAIPVPGAGETPSQHYSMYVARVEREDGQIAGLGEAVLISPEGSANSCGWFHPTDPGLVLFGCTIIPPSEENVPGYQRGTGTYRWAFPTEMDMVTRRLWPEGAEPRIHASNGELTTAPVETMFTKPGYDAEGSWSPDGRHVLYANVDMLKSAVLGRADADLWVYDTELDEHRVLIDAEGYDGGPFFGPATGPASHEGKPGWITYRSDREGNNLLQLFITELDYGDPDDPAKITGIKREVQITDNGHVNWCPYWENDGRFLVYATSELGHWNYEIYAVGAVGSDGDPVVRQGDRANTVRITHAEGFDGLPVFSPDGHYMMWTSQRGPMVEGESRPSSQLWIARVDRDRIAAMVHGAVPRTTP